MKEVEVLKETIQEVLRSYFNDMYKKNESNKLSEELITGVIIKLQGKLMEQLTPLIINKEKKNV